MIMNVSATTYSFCFDYIIFVTTPFKIHLLCQNPMYNSGVIGGLKVGQFPRHLL